MPARILDGNAYAAEIRNEISRDVADFTIRHGPIRLCSILVGADPAGRLYADSQQHRCRQAGVQHDLLELPDDITQRELIAHIHRLNADATVTGIMLHLPLPPHMDAASVQYHLDPYKDVEGVNPANIGLLFYDTPIIAPCTALAVMEMVQRSGIEVRGAEAVVVGQSRIVGRPVSMFLTTRMATVTGCHIATRDLRFHTRRADIVVVAVGRPKLLDGSYFKPGAVVIDVGINRVESRDADGRVTRKTVGDVDFESAVEVAGALTPVPGGVGPLTVMMLLRNTVEAARKQLNRTL